MCDYCPSPYGWRQPGGMFKCNDCIEKEELRRNNISLLKKRNRLLEEQNEILKKALKR